MKRIAAARLAFALIIGLAVGDYAVFGATPMPDPTPPPFDLSCAKLPPPQKSGSFQTGPYMRDSKHPPVTAQAVPFYRDKDSAAGSNVQAQGVFPDGPPSDCPPQS